MSLVNNISQPMKQVANNLTNFSKQHQVELLTLAAWYSKLVGAIKNLWMTAVTVLNKVWARWF